MRAPRTYALLTVLALALAPFGCSSHRAASQAASPAPSPTASLPAEYVRFMQQNRDRPEAYVGKTVRQIVNYQIGYENGQRSIANYERNLKRNALKMAALMEAHVLGARDGARAIAFDVVLHNKTAKAFKHVDVWLVATDATTRKQVGEIELNIDHAVPPHATVRFALPVRYANFGSATGSMMAASGRPKTDTTRPDAIEFADGSDVGIADD
jgi:hypothetical protein